MTGKEPWFTDDAFSDPEQGVDVARQKAEDEKSRRASRFWLPEGTKFTKNVLFLDDKAFGYYEHELKINGKWGNYFTCLKGSGRCPLCEIGERPYYIGLLTCVDLTGYEDENGVRKGKNRILLFPAKMDTLDLLKMRRQTSGLALCAYKVTRLGEKAPRVGNDFVFMKKVNNLVETKIPDIKDAKPFDYREVTKPYPIDELEQIAALKLRQKDGGGHETYERPDKGAPAVGASTAGGSADIKDADLPF